MALSDQGWQTQVLLEAGLPLAGGPLPDTLTTQMMSALQAQMPTIWEMAGVWAARVPPGYQVTVRFLAAKQRAIMVLMGQLRGRKDQMVGRVLRVSWSQVFRALYQIYQLTTADLKVEWAQAVKAGGGMVLAPLLQTAPVMPADQYAHVPGPGEPFAPDPYAADPNDPYYTGGFGGGPGADPYFWGA